VALGLLSTLYALFRKASRSAGELARINSTLEAEMAERSRAEQERDRFFEMSADLLSINGFDGRILQVNPAWEKMLGYSPAELRGRLTLELVHPDDRESTLREAQKLRLGGTTIDFENRYLARDGTPRWLSWRSAPNLERAVVYSVARDVDDRRKVEQMKSDFIAVVSHELRTPMTSIRGSLGLLVGGVAGELPEKAVTLVAIAAKNSERLVRLINDILDIEKIESGKMGFRFAPVELMPLIEQAVATNGFYAEQYAVRFKVTDAAPGCRVWADSDRILQVLTNYLSNAAKFSPRGGTVEVAVIRREGRVTVSVADRGRGIPPEFQQRIFEKFAQADASSTRQKGGTGLGLSISKAIVERHGGKVWFETEAGVGTVFFFELLEWGSR
jgi:PAS domain S-box-containing protein